MEEPGFWQTLEVRVCAELAGQPVRRLQYLWCDGFLPDEYLLRDRRPRIVGRAWICNGSRPWEWAFVLHLPRPARSRETLDWAALLPPTDAERWLVLNEAERRVEITAGGRMACRGVFFALTTGEAERLLAAETGAEALEIVTEEIEEAWDEEWLQETDKAWDAIHRCLTDGTLRFEGDTPLHRCVLGGRQLYEEEDYILSFVAAAEVAQVAAAIRDLDEAWMRRKYFQIDPDDYGFPLTEEDFQYTWEWFRGVQAFYQKAAAHHRPVIFTVDQ